MTILCPKTCIPQWTRQEKKLDWTNMIEMYNDYHCWLLVHGSANTDQHHVRLDLNKYVYYKANDLNSWTEKKSGT